MYVGMRKYYSGAKAFQIERPQSEPQSAESFFRIIRQPFFRLRGISARFCTVLQLQAQNRD